MPAKLQSNRMVKKVQNSEFKKRRFARQKSYYLTCIHTRVLLTHLSILPFLFLQKLRIHHVWFLFGVILVLIRLLTILEQSLINKLVRIWIKLYGQKCTKF